MKKGCLILISILLAGFISAQEFNFGTGNGKIISQEENNNYIITTRKHYQELALEERSKKVYAKLNDTRSVGRLNVGEDFAITELIYMEPKKGDKDEYSLWCKITYNGNETGFLNCGKVYKDYLPYLTEDYSIVEEVKTPYYNWTYRKLEGLVSNFTGNINMRDKPGTKGTKVVGSVPKSYSSEDIGQVNVEYSLITEEKEQIDEDNAPWIYITWNGISGWVYSAYFSVERGGPKFYTPEAQIYYIVVLDMTV